MTCQWTPHQHEGWFTDCGEYYESSLLPPYCPWCDRDINKPRKLMNALKWIECRLYGVAILIVGLMLTPLVFAQETLDYTGQLMVGTLTGIEPPPFVTTEITGDVVLGQALNPNEIDQIVTPTTYNFGGLMVPQLTQPTYSGWVGNAPVFEFSTVNGNVTQWTVLLSAFLPGQSGTLSLTNAGDQYFSQMWDGYCSFHSDCGEYSATSHQAGVWVDPPTIKSTLTAPEMDWSRAIAALTLLCAAVLVIKDSRRV
jgi:hypothetical protein